jgi:hypothetical protein
MPFSSGAGRCICIVTILTLSLLRVLPVDIHHPDVITLSKKKWFSEQLPISSLVSTLFLYFNLNTHKVHGIFVNVTQQ